MKKIFDVADLAAKNGGEYVLGSHELNTHACYMVFGKMESGETGRTIKPGKGHEEIFSLVQGEVKLRNGSREFVMKPGQAFHLAGEESYQMDNTAPGRSVYVIAGGHSEHHDH